MEKNENLVTEEVAENVEQTTEETPIQETPKTYTQEEVDAIVGKAKARNTAKIRKEYDRKYGELENVLRAGTGKESIEEMTDTFSKFYESKGIKINKSPDYTNKDIEVLAKAEADEIIGGGFEDVIEEADRLKAIGAKNMTAKEKALFKKLTDHIRNTERMGELADIGVSEDVYQSREFTDFASQFNSDVPVKKIYDYYQQTQPKKNIKPMGSMKNNVQDSGVKDYYSPEEARRFTQAEINNNPALVAAIERSMRKWK